MSLKRDDHSDFGFFGWDPFFDEDKDGKLSSEEQMYAEIFLDETTRDDPKDEDDDAHGDDILKMFSSDESSDAAGTDSYYGFSGNHTTYTGTSTGTGIGHNASTAYRPTTSYQYHGMPNVAATNVKDTVSEPLILTKQQYRSSRRILKLDIIYEIVYRVFLSIFPCAAVIASFMVDAPNSASVFAAIIVICVALYFLGKIWIRGAIGITKSINEIDKLDREYSHYRKRR